MKILFSSNIEDFLKAELKLISSFGNKVGDTLTNNVSHLCKNLKVELVKDPQFQRFESKCGNSIHLSADNFEYRLVAFSSKKSLTLHALRKVIATQLKVLKKQNIKSLAIDLRSFCVGKKVEESIEMISEAIGLADYEYNELKKSTQSSLKSITIFYDDKKLARKADKLIERSLMVADSVNIARDFVNCPPNILNSETYAKKIQDDIKKNLKDSNVTLKTLGKKELQKENMNLFLSVNAGSAYDPKLVHLTYTPKKMTKKTKHICLVGKGITFDTGGYSLKPSASMVKMKFDMAGSSTMYGAFRAAALLGANVKITCLMGITDNAVNSKATMPDSVIKARNGKTVEILNTDAEGRLVLADVLDYACDLEPDALIDSATLTGACLVALGTEVCAVMSNNKKLTSDLLRSAKNQDEYMWELPIIEEFRDDLKSPIADLKNIGGSRWGGTPKAGAFLEEFVKEGTAWAHLDIAGVADSQKHLAHCPASGGSGVIIRTLTDYLMK